MEGISDIKICGIDETRPPRIRKEPYIDLFFKLTHQAPKQWCEDFNRLFSEKNNSVKIQPDKGLFIETWVRSPDEIAEVLEKLKLSVSACNQQYITRILDQAHAAEINGDVLEDAGEQGRLNRIVAGLKYDD
ncbi:MAG: hypothetical protein PVG50_00150 [Thiohalophilus sp.]|jgi:hypothetical protein